jgi:hypothetical protein
MGAHIYELGHRDGRFVRAGGVYVLTRRTCDGRLEALYVGEAAVIAATVGPGHPAWCQALQLGLSGLLVVLEADPERRRRFAREMEATLAPVLNGALRGSRCAFRAPHHDVVRDGPSGLLTMTKVVDRARTP